MRSYSFSDVNRQAGEVLDAALAAPVMLTKRGKRKLVVISVEEYERSFQRAYTIENVPDDVLADLIAGLDDSLEKS